MKVLPMPGKHNSLYINNYFNGIGGEWLIFLQMIIQIFFDELHRDIEFAGLPAVVHIMDSSN
jgi:hypothetical protein